MEKRLVTRYATTSAAAADENQRRVEAVFDELAAAKPDNVSYIVLRLADDSFVHVSFHDHGDDEVNPITSTAAFAHGSRRITPIVARVASISRPRRSSAPTSRSSNSRPSRGPQPVQRGSGRSRFQCRTAEHIHLSSPRVRGRSS